MVLSTPRATIDLASAREALAKSLGERARVSTLHDMVVVDVDAARLVEVATVVRDDPATRCDLYSVNAGVDTGTELRSVTFVRGIETHVFVMLRTPCDSGEPHVPSLTSVWDGANWCERETYDMFGIVFDGHPDLRRIFLEESFPGHPMRKSFLPPRSDARGG
ncbi:MAG: NADH-quinone oxidoreductase subunit C [Chloroflexi bacterium]|nr:MAG: NADH-quinone oxidoreductase subunit C [Chloroflexota bacterium]TMF56009.1 MAG: NADH-quinone oxidoreductase subunit C [Chloroflexota bacterium]